VLKIGTIVGNGTITLSFSELDGADRLLRVHAFQVWAHVANNGVAVAGTVQVVLDGTGLPAPDSILWGSANATELQSVQDNTVGFLTLCERTLPRAANGSQFSIKLVAAGFDAAADVTLGVDYAVVPYPDASPHEGGAP